MARRSAHAAMVMIAVIALVGCSRANYRVPASAVIGIAERIDSVLIAVPEDGRFDDKVYVGTGHFVAHRTAQEFLKYTKQVMIAPSGVHDREALLSTARKANEAYLVIPTITQWEHRIKTIPSRAQIGMTVIEVASGREIGSALLAGDSSAAILKDSSPNEVAIVLVREFVRRLYEGADQTPQLKN
jgi:hypothetical protein